jgi:hypothetical protein
MEVEHGTGNIMHNVADRDTGIHLWRTRGVKDMDQKQLRRAIKEVLSYLGVYSKAAEELLMLTAAQETHCGKYLWQIDGPARGIFQMEPDTETDLWMNFLHYNEELTRKVGNLTMVGPGYVGTEGASRTDKKLFSKFDLKYNIAYQIAMARMQYYRHSEPLPAADDVPALADYYKKYYNTYSGAATVSEAMENYFRYAV